MKRLAAFIGFIFLWGCFATIPPAIKDSHLSEIKPAEQKKLDTIEAEIISINKDKDKAKNEYKITQQQAAISKQEISRLEEQKKLLAEKEKLFIMKEDPEKISQIHMEIKDTEKKLANEKIHFEYLESKKKKEELYLELSEARLSVKVAELEYEKSKIAKAYQDRRKKQTQGKVKEKEKKKGLLDFAKKDKNTIDVQKYSDYLKNQREKLTKRETDYKNYLPEYEKAKSKYEAIDK